MSEKSSLSKYLDANPVADAEEAIKKGDFRFLAVRGYTVIVPGVEDYESKYASKYAYRIIEGTSDAISGPADRQLQLQVRDYAKKYNQTLVNQIES